MYSGRSIDKVRNNVNLLMVLNKNLKKLAFLLLRKCPYHFPYRFGWIFHDPFGHEKLVYIFFTGKHHLYIPNI